jgi:hypothetical protein
VPTSELDAIRSEPDDAGRAVLARTYLIRGEAKLAEARSIRDEALRALGKRVGPTEAARLTGASLAMVKLALR